MNNITIYPKKIQYVADNFGLIILTFLALLASGYNNREIKNITLMVFAILSLILIYKWLLLKSIKWIISEEQIINEYGVFQKEINYLELYRIYDYREKQNFVEQIINTKRITVLSGDKSNPQLTMFGLEPNTNIIEIIRKRVENNKQKKHIYEISNR